MQWAPEAMESMTKRMMTPSPKALWVEVERGFHVGNDHGRYLGSVTVAPDGSITAFGERSDFLGAFDSVDAAKTGVLSANADETVRTDVQARPLQSLLSRLSVMP